MMPTDMTPEEHTLARVALEATVRWWPNLEHTSFSVWWDRPHFAARVRVQRADRFMQVTFPREELLRSEQHTMRTRVEVHGHHWMRRMGRAA